MDENKKQQQSNATYTVNEKEEILKIASLKGVKQAAKQYNISEVTIYNWRKQYQENGISGLEDKRGNNQGGKPVPAWKRQKVLSFFPRFQQVQRVQI